MDEASSKAAEELFHRTLNFMKKDPSEFISPKLKERMTPNSLAWMSICGMTYFVLVGLTIFVSSLIYTIPVACRNDPDATFNTRLLTSFLMFNIVVNFILVCKNRSFYNGGYKNNAGDFDKEVCLDCGHDIPPRVHHCSLCRRCVVKRDHHCFFTGTCVGYKNQRYFLVYCFYCAVGCIYMLFFAFQYLSIVHGHPSETGYYNLILPVVIFQWLFGYSSLGYLCSVALLCLCILTGVGSVCIFIWQFFIAIYGTTSYEFWKKGGIGAIRPFQIPIRKNLYSVFGPFWFLNFIFPMTFLRQPEDGIEWSLSKEV